MEVEKGSMTVVGRFDAKKLRDRVANKTRKNVDFVVAGGSSSNKGGGGGGNGKQGGESGGGNQHKGATEVDGKQADKGGEQEGKEKDKADRQEEGKGKGGGKDNKKPVVVRSTLPILIIPLPARILFFSSLIVRMTRSACQICA